MTKPDPFSLAQHQPQRYLLNLMVEDAKRNLEAEIIEGIRPRIREHVERAFFELAPQIEAHFDFASKDMGLVLTVRNREDGKHA